MGYLTVDLPSAQPALLLVPALLLDRWLGEPKRFHPLVGFGHLALWVEKGTYGPGGISPGQRRLRGLLAVVVLLVPLSLVGHWFGRFDGVGAGFQVMLLYLAVGGRSLFEHGLAVPAALATGGLAAARQRVGYLVSRETGGLDESAIARATVESVLENGNDAIFGVLFWFLLLGAPGAILYRLANTLDAMWGYKNDRYRAYGWAAARLDDLFNLVPARLTALTYLLVGSSVSAWRGWRACRHRKSPNATLVMAVGAGALTVALGGAAIYHGRRRENPRLGEGPPASMADIPRAIALVRRGVVVWGAVSLLLGVWSLA